MLSYSSNTDVDAHLFVLASVKVEFGDELLVLVLEVLPGLLLRREPACSAPSVVLHVYYAVVLVAII